jgi:HD-GYP domain-containing protein (c-di-GMP phosphodiesterase class II)
VRIIALADTPFRDVRLDGLVYSYAPPATEVSLLERLIANAFDHIHLLSTRREYAQRLEHAAHEIHELNQIGAALSAEHDTDRLLEMILTKSRAITKADAGSLYLVETVGGDEEGKQPEKKMLRFRLAQNDSINLPFKQATMEISPRSIAGYVAGSGAPVNIEDAYHVEDVPYSINRKFDEDSGYRTKSILAVPMRNQKDEILGVIQLINAKRDTDARLTSLASVVQQVVPFSTRQQEIVGSLASQAAVALENSRLYAAIQAMLEGFVKASVTAIEARDPTTSGHSFRVSNLTVALAEAVDRCGEGPYRDVKFSRTEMKEIRYAALLHDFGKVGVREEVLVKAKKLYPLQTELIRQRFHLVKRAAEAGVLRRRLECVLQEGREQYLAREPEFEKELEEQIKKADEFVQVVMQANEPSVLPAGHFEQLLDIAAQSWLDDDGAEKPLLTEDEVRLLSIRKGSLDDAERRQIESHVVHTYNFLKQIPWTKEIRNIPQIARGHHEKLNGQGYPYKLSEPEIPVQTRMMTVSDIFDALSAADRPYKRAVPQERALEILGFAVKDQEIDGELFKVFTEARVFEKWKVEPYPY